MIKTNYALRPRAFMLKKPKKTIMIKVMPRAALTSAFLDEVSNSFGLVVGHFEDIAEAVENDLHNLSVLHCEQVAEWRDHVLLNQVCHLETSQTVKDR